jgi:hypothetical protein
MFSKLYCWLGFHDYEVISVTFGFGVGGSVEKVQCNRCGFTTTRREEYYHETRRRLTVETSGGVAVHWEILLGVYLTVIVIFLDITGLSWGICI